MGFNDELARVADRHAGPKCSVALWRAKQTPDDRDQFDAALVSTKTTASIHLAMKAMEYDGSSEPVKRHRRGDCRCGLVQ